MPTIPISGRAAPPGLPPGRMKAVGVILIVVGVLLLPAGAALLLLLMPQMDYTGPLHLAAQGMFAAIAATGLFGLLGGIYAVRNGRQHGALRTMTLLCAVTFIALCFEFNSLHRSY